MYYEPNIAAAAVRQTSIARVAVVGSLLSLLLWSVIIAAALSFIQY
jgi:hypothetical protein